MPTSLPPERVAAVIAGLAAPAAATIAGRRAVHVLYGGAHLYRRGGAAKLGAIARAAMHAFGDDEQTFARSVGLADATLAGELARRVREKLEREPIEKTCIDFEDGYGPRPDAEEDADAVRAASELASEPPGGRPIVGVRIKALSPESARRGIRTLDLFLTTLARATGGRLPDGFTVTLPKVSRAEEVAALASLLSSLEQSLGIASAARIGIELMVETPRALLDEEGRVALPRLVAAADGRCVAAHLGAYDLTASLGVTAGEQRLDHPACDAARLLMQLALAGTSVEVVDGATTVLPTGKDGEAVRAAWSLHAKAVRRALALGIYQGWDLHPAQLPARYGAVYGFFLAERAAMTARLRGFVAKATQATRAGQIFDDAATGQGLLAFFARGVACGALEEDELTATGLSLDEVRGRSFARIVESRALYSADGSST
ncbi:MAG TPA: phosphoenolpyruvate kinase [Labilithrix sp.]|nr:phosphoenolpyruvate kinase [Labilithrix sp.]